MKPRDAQLLFGLLALVWLACLTAIAQDDAAADSNNPYKSIIERNAFGLNPPPPPQTNAAPPQPPTVLKITGIMVGMDGVKRVWLEVPSKSTNAAQYLNLCEGERQNNVEIMKISEEAGEVKVLNGGIIQTLSFEKDSNKGAPGAAPPPLSGGAPPPMPMPTATVAPNTTPAPMSRGVTVTGGGAMHPPPNPAPQPAMPSISIPAPPSPSAMGLRTIPTRTLRLNPVQQAPATGNPPENQQVDPLTQRAQMELIDQLHQEAGIVVPPLPPRPPGMQ